MLSDWYHVHLREMVSKAAAGSEWSEEEGEEGDRQCPVMPYRRAVRRLHFMLSSLIDAGVQGNRLV